MAINRFAFACLLLSSLARCSSMPPDQRCDNFNGVVASIADMRLAGDWAHLNRAEVLRRLQTKARANTVGDTLVIEGPTVPRPCTCWYAARFRNDELYEITIVRKEADHQTALGHAMDLVNVVRPSAEPELAVEPSDYKLYRWTIAEEERTHRQLGLEYDVKRCARNWQLSTTITFFSFRAN